jgi:hypothetical protein
VTNRRILREVWRFLKSAECGVYIIGTLIFLAAVFAAFQQ